MANYMTPLQHAAWKKRLAKRKSMKEEETEDRVFVASTDTVRIELVEKKFTKKKASKKKFTKKS